MKTPTVNPFHEISLIDIAHRHKMLIEKRASELVIAYYHAKLQNNVSKSAQFKATQAKLSATCLPLKMVGDAGCEMEEDLRMDISSLISSFTSKHHAEF